MRNLLSIDHLDKDIISSLLVKAGELTKNIDVSLDNKQYIANLFYENSTRTRVSFEVAANQLGMKVINFDALSSSEQKGEEILDTLKTLHAMGIHCFVVRHSKEGLVRELSNELKTAAFINAGDGTACHPTQTLTDLFTILQEKSLSSKLRVVILGDIKHSRVANSLISGLSMMGINDICLSAPSVFMPENTSGLQVEENINKALDGADVIVTLRVQKERIKSTLDNMFAEYSKLYCLDENKLAKAKSDVIVMHPGPMNRGIEIASSVADGKHSVILKQVRNSIFVRMAVLKYVFS